MCLFSFIETDLISDYYSLRLLYWIDQLDGMLCHSMPLGQLLSSKKRKVSKASHLGPITRKKEKRSWVVRMPSVFVFTGAKTGGFQTISKSMTPLKANLYFNDLDANNA